MTFLISIWSDILQDHRTLWRSICYQCTDESDIPKDEFIRRVRHANQNAGFVGMIILLLPAIVLQLIIPKNISPENVPARIGSFAGLFFGWVTLSIPLGVAVFISTNHESAGEGLMKPLGALWTTAAACGLEIVGFAVAIPFVTALCVGVSFAVQAAKSRWKARQRSPEDIEADIIRAHGTV